MGDQSESVNTVEQDRGDVQSVIEDIAGELNIKEWEIDCKKQDFSGDNFLGEIVRAKIISKNNNNSFKAINLIIKIAPQSAEIRDGIPINTFYRNEIAFYNKIVPIIKKLQDDHRVPLNECILFPILYKGILDEFKELVVMRDLSHDGYILRDKKIPMDYEHLTMIVQNLARLHSASFILKEKDPELFERCSQHLPKTVNYGHSFERMIVKMPEKVQPRIVNQANRLKLKSFGDAVVQNIHNYLDASLSDPYNVICHGDAWNNNMLFKYQEEKLSTVVFIDYQLSRMASPVTDISYVLCFSADLEVFENRFKDILKSYYDTLEISLTRMNCSIEKCYPKEIFKEHIKRFMGFGLMMGMCGIPMTLTDEGQQLNTTDDLVTQLDQGTYGSNISDLATERLNRLVDVYAKIGLI